VTDPTPPIHPPAAVRRRASRVAAAVVVTALVPLLWPGSSAAQEDPSSTTTPESTSTTLPSTTSSTTTTTTPGDTTTTTPAPTAPPVPESTTTLVPTTAPLPPTVEEPDGSGRGWSIAPRFTVPADDSVASAQMLLTQVVAAIEEVQARRTTLEQRIATGEAEVRQTRQRLEDLERKRKARAVGAFINGDAIVESKIQVDDQRVRIITSIEGIETMDGQRRRAIEVQIARLDQRIRDDRSSLAATEPELAELNAARQMLQDKISSALDTTVDVPVGPTDIAVTAAAALGRRRSASALTAAGDLAGAAAATEAERRELERLAALVARPTPGAYNPDGTPKSIGPTPAVDPATLATRLLAEWSLMDDRRMTVMLFALQQVGKRYVWGGAGPDVYDCSGLVMRAWALAGVRLEHGSASQVASGPPVAVGEMIPGDLLGYGPGSNKHVTMYIGADRVVEAKGSAYGVIVNNARYADMDGAARMP